MSEVHTLSDVVDHGRIAVCCGSGGVGKTTTAAIIAIEGARRGRRAVVVTIDPAKRLANALGLDGLTNEPRVIDTERWDPDDDRVEGGELSAMMLDTKSTFDGLVTRYAESEEQAQRILANNFYRNISGALSGTQEYMAMEKLHELYEDGGFDLIVVDTPPSRHALDFLDAPERLLRLLNNPIFRGADGAGPHRPPHRRRRGPGVHPHGVAVSWAPRSSTTSSRSSARSRGWRRASGHAPRASSRSSSNPRRGSCS